MDGEVNSASSAAVALNRIGSYHQLVLDRMTPYLAIRWIFTITLVVIFFGRVIMSQGWYIIMYAWGIYLLNLFIAFLSPKIDPAWQDMEDDDAEPALPTKQNEEFKPFMRRLPEFKFWYSTTKATWFALVATLFEFFNIPVFWPILVMYFFILFTVTMKRQIRHMIKYRYIPVIYGKPKYSGREDTGKVVGSPT